MEKVTLSTPARVSASLVELHSLGVIGSRDQENIGLINNSLDDFKLGGDRGGVKVGGEEEKDVRGLHQPGRGLDISQGQGSQAGEAEIRLPGYNIEVSIV